MVDTKESLDRMKELEAELKKAKHALKLYEQAIYDIGFNFEHIVSLQSARRAAGEIE